MTVFDPTVQALLLSLHIQPSAFLGEGSESQTFNYTDETVLRIYKGAVAVEYLEKLRDLYHYLASHNLPFALPEMYEIQQRDERVFVIEKKLAGQPIASLYELLDARQRQRLLANYFAAISAFRTITFPKQTYGHVMDDPEHPTAYTNWRQFIQETAPLKLPATRAILEADGIDLDRVLAKFEQDLLYLPDQPARNFVHGDYFFGNIMVNEQLEVSAVLDVSWWSLVGDHMMDAAGTVMFADLYEYVSPQERQYLSTLAVQIYGDAILHSIRIYRIYYSLLLSDCKTFDPRAYHWSLKNLQQYML